jgi:hypothetical protein
MDDATRTALEVMRVRYQLAVDTLVHREETATEAEWDHLEGEAMILRQELQDAADRAGILITAVDSKDWFIEWGDDGLGGTPSVLSPRGPGPQHPALGDYRRRGELLAQASKARADAEAARAAGDHAGAAAAEQELEQVEREIRRLDEGRDAGDNRDQQRVEMPEADAMSRTLPTPVEAAFAQARAASRAAQDRVNAAVIARDTGRGSQEELHAAELDWHESRERLQTARRDVWAEKDREAAGTGGPAVERMRGTRDFDLQARVRDDVRARIEANQAASRAAEEARVRANEHARGYER